MNIIEDIWNNKNYKVAKKFLTEISERQKEASTKDSYQTILTDYANRCFETALKRLLEEGYYVVMHYCKNNNNILTLHEQYKESSFIIQADFMKEEDIYHLTLYS